MEPLEAELNKKTGSNIPMNIIKDKRELFVKGIFAEAGFQIDAMKSAFDWPIFSELFLIG